MAWGTRSLAALGGIVVIGALAFFLTREPAGPGMTPPLPADLANAEPAVAELIRSAHADLQEDPRNSLLWLQLGLVYEANGRMTLAEQCLHQSIELDGAEAMPHYHLAAIARIRGNGAAEIRHLEAAISRFPDYAPAHWRHGMRLLETTHIDDARAAFERATEIDRNDPAAWVGLARTYVEENDHESAIPLLERLAATIPMNRPYVHQLLGAAYRQAGRLDAAAAALGQSHGEPTPWPDPWYDQINSLRRDAQWRHQYALSLISAGRPAEAARMLHDLRGERPNDTDLLSDLAVAYRSAGDLDRSIAVLRESLDAGLQSSQTHFNLAYALQLKSRSASPGDSALLRTRVLKHLDEALSLNPSNAAALGFKGETLVELGEEDRAIEALRSAAQVDRASALWPLREALVHLRRDRLRAARERIEESLRRDPNFVPSIRELVSLEIRERHADAAEQALGRLRTLTPGDPSLAELAAAIRSLRGGT